MKTKKGGMTLVEVIVAMAIFGIVAVGVVSMFINGFNFVLQAGDASEAGFKSVGQVENILNNNDNSSKIDNFIKFYDNLKISVYGAIDQVSIMENNNKVDITYFLPGY